MVVSDLQLPGWKGPAADRPSCRKHEVFNGDCAARVISLICSRTKKSDEKAVREFITSMRHESGIGTRSSWEHGRASREQTGLVPGTA